MQGLIGVPGAQQCLPFVRMFYGMVGTVATPISFPRQRGGGARRPVDASVVFPASTGAPQAIQSQLKPNELLLAYLDDLYAVVQPDRVRAVYDLMAHEFFQHAHIQLNSGKTRVWNASGATPPGLEPLGPEVWAGSQHLLPQEQGLTILGTPVGSEAYIQRQLQNTRQNHQHLLQRIPDIDDLQASWFLLFFCASPRCNHILRTTAPALAADFAADHDVAVAGCLQQVFGGPGSASHSSGHSPCATCSRWLGLAICHSHRTSSILGVLGRHSAHLLPAFTARVQDFFPQSHPSPTVHPSSPPNSRHAQCQWLEPTNLARPNKWHARSYEVLHLSRKIISANLKI